MPTTPPPPPPDTGWMPSETGGHVRYVTTAAGQYELRTEYPTYTMRPGNPVPVIDFPATWLCIGPDVDARGGVWAEEPEAMGTADRVLAACGGAV